MSHARAFGACDPYAFHATGNLDSPQRVFEFCIPVEVSMDVVVSFFSSSGSEAVSSLLTVPKDDSGILSVIPIAQLFSANTFKSQCLTEDSDMVDSSDGRRHSVVRIGEPLDPVLLFSSRSLSNAAYLAVHRSGSDTLFFSMSVQWPQL